MVKKSLEICVSNVDSARAAKEGGADRIELCDNLGEGGTTPSHGMIIHCLRQLNIPVNVLIRPRGGDFLYSGDEFDIMCKDIAHAKDLGAHGIVSGILTNKGKVDIDRMEELISLSKPMSFTFHRAFDFVRDPFEAMETIITLGANRILTSGQQPSAIEGAELLKTLNKKSANRIIIMPGCGINSGNIKKLIAITSCTEYHGTAKRMSTSGLETNTSVSSSVESSLPVKNFNTDQKEVAAMKALIQE